MTEPEVEKKQLVINIGQQHAILCMLNHTYSLLYGAARTGKSFIILFQMLYIANKYVSRHLICRFHFSEVKKSIIKETLPKVAKLMGITYTLNQQDWYITLPNGSEIWITGVDEARGMDRILGKEYLTIWFNEVSSMSYGSYTTILTRLAQQVFKLDSKGKKIIALNEEGKPLRDRDNKIKYQEVTNRIFCDENPTKKSHWSHKLFVDHIEPGSNTLLPNPEDYGVMQLNAEDNAQNLSESFLLRQDRLPPKERKRFFSGEFSDDISGALFTERILNQYRIINHPDLVEIVVSIDPAITAKATSDETGIIVAGRDINDRGYVLADRSGIYTPAEWAAIAVKLFDQYDASYILGEENQGGLMVSHTIQSEDKNVPVKLIRATKGKILRAEPISILYENGRISHVGAFPDLEDEMTSYTGVVGDESPNRLDALVHGFTALFPIGRSIESEYFRDKMVHMSDEHDLSGSTNIGYIRLTKSENYNFTMLCLKIKDKRAFLTDVLFNDSFPNENLDSIKKLVEKNKIETFYIEAPITYATFVREMIELDICSVRGIKAVEDNENRILIESKFIIDKFVIKKEPSELQYKEFIRQIDRFTSMSEEDEKFAADALSGACAVLKKLYSDEIL